MTHTMEQKKPFKALDIAYIGVCTALIAVCSYISIPTVVPFTLQTLAVFLVMQILGGRNGFYSVLAYLLLGAVGVPVFAGFTGGPGVLFGTTGGYLIGFLLMAMLYWAAEALVGEALWVRIVSLIAGLAVCYAFGTVWFLFLYNRSNDPVGISTALGWCVLPFLIPDGIKLAAATGLAAALRPVLRKQ
ncbi:MAG: biotin transporter BioY [Oscillospiraceae bacterium]|nr:biotin transporter BioY [Oscillospiraceae bacterium]